jgi:glycosyltransferase involved in cell wall biosynthesis
LKVAIVHHWFVTRGGGERVAECLASLFPRADLFTLVASDAGLPESLRGRRLTSSFLQKLPLGTTQHRHFLPLYPSAVERLNVSAYDLVISSDSGPVKGVRVREGALQVCYCHSPMRYLWDGYESYSVAMGPLTRTAFSLTAPRVRAWDRRAAQRVSYFIANSRYVQERIARCYGRESVVIHPPIDVEHGRISEKRSEHYLCAGRLVSYKKTELMIEGCARMGRPLRIAGTGPEEARLRRLAASLAGAQVAFLGELSQEALWREYAECRALLFAADEDFGMVPLEAQACGRPVIAFGKGGSLETVRGVGPAPTGVYFEKQTAASLIDALQRFEAAEARGEFEAGRIRAWAEEFATPVFLRRMRDYLLSVCPDAAGEMAEGM